MARFAGADSMIPPGQNFAIGRPLKLGLLKAAANAEGSTAEKGNSGRDEGPTEHKAINVTPILKPVQSALVRKIRIILVNHAHLDLLVNETFQTTLGEKLQQVDDPSVTVASTGNGSAPEPAANYETAVDLVCRILARMQLPHTEETVKGWCAQACSTFAQTRAKANIMTAARVRFVAQWVLRALSEHAIRGSHDFFNRTFLAGFDHSPHIHESGLQLSGAVAHGAFGNIWLHAKDKSVMPASTTPTLTSFALSRLRASMSAGSSSTPVTPSPLPALSALRAEHVVCSVSKTLCKLPPELLSKRIKFLIETGPIPHVLPLQDAYEDYEHIHLVYRALSPSAMCLIDKVFDDMHATEDDTPEVGAFTERTIQQIIWRLLSATKEAHSRGLVHGALRMGCIYLDDPDNLDTMQILEFGLNELFDLPEAVPPAAILTPSEGTRTDPVPFYRRDLQCIGEIAYLLLTSRPIAPLTSSSEELLQRAKRGTAHFDMAHPSLTENAKAFVLDILRPPCFKKLSKIQACHEVAMHMNHRWFFPQSSAVGTAMNEVYDMVMVRRYDTWRNTLRLRLNFLKLMADHMSVYRIHQLWDRLALVAEKNQKVSWAVMVPEILQHCPVLHLLQKVNKAFGESEEAAVIPVEETRQTMEAWRKKRVREVVWQIFNRGRAYDGVISADLCNEGLVNKVNHVWSRPLRVVDVLVPAEGNSGAATARTIAEIIGGQDAITYVELIGKTDAGREYAAVD